MTEPQPEPEEEESPETPQPPPEAGAGGDDAASQIAGLKDQLLRALAEAENARRRAQKEREDTAKYAVANFAREMVTIADNFHRALEAVPQDTNDPALKNVIAGLQATERQLQAALERFGIKKLEPLGQPFDPNFHRVMMEIDDPDQPPGTILQVLQSGYMIQDRLLREALVGVAKGSNATVQKVDTSA
jgi:molecular chaperone GrpE